MIKVFTTGFLHWFLQRTSAISLLLLFLILFAYKNVIIATGLFVLLFLHVNIGFETLIDDYIHDFYFKIFGGVILRLIIIYCIKFIFLVCIF
jgi:succinate dehydrogenase hydrophobic anchor subunit